MGRIRTLLVAITAAITAAIIVSSSAVSALAAPRVATPPGATVGTLTGLFLWDSYPHGQLQRSSCRAPNVCHSIGYRNDASRSGTADGVAKLDRWIRSTPGRKIVHGYSLGATVAVAWLRTYGTDPTAPGPAELSFLLVGSPERAGTGSLIHAPGHGAVPADTRYSVTDVCRQWDSVCDSTSPAPWWVNRFGIHLFYERVDLADPRNVVTVAGNVTAILVPTR